MPEMFREVTIIADADHTIEAIGEPVIPPVVEHTIIASAKDGCTITPEGVLSVVEGTAITFTIGTFEGYQIKEILVDGVAV
jgi:hypothetical protein